MATAAAKLIQFIETENTKPAYQNLNEKELKKLLKLIDACSAGELPYEKVCPFIHSHLITQLNSEQARMYVKSILKHLKHADANQIQQLNLQKILKDPGVLDILAENLEQLPLNTPTETLVLVHQFFLSKMITPDKKSMDLKRTDSRTNSGFKHQESLTAGDQKNYTLSKVKPILEQLRVEMLELNSQRADEIQNQNDSLKNTIKMQELSSQRTDEIQNSIVNMKNLINELIKNQGQLEFVVKDLKSSLSEGSQHEKQQMNNKLAFIELNKTIEDLQQKVQKHFFNDEKVIENSLTLEKRFEDYVQQEQQFRLKYENEFKSVWNALTNYFDEQAQEFIRFIYAQNRDYQQFQPFVQRNPINTRLSSLREKMDCMGWLIRSQKFIRNELQLQMIKAFKETELPIGDPERRLRYQTATSESQAVLSICLSLETLLKTTEEFKNCNLILQTLELLVLNEDAADQALAYGKLQQSLNEILLLTGYNKIQQQDSVFIKLLLRVMSALMRKAECQRQFAGVSSRPINALLNLLSELQDKELVVNGLSCISQALTHQQAFICINKELPGFQERIERIQRQYQTEDHSYIQHEGALILKRFEQNSKLSELGQVQTSSGRKTTPKLQQQQSEYLRKIQKNLSQRQQLKPEEYNTPERNETQKVVKLKQNYATLDDVYQNQPSQDWSQQNLKLAASYGYLN